jgi:hypothetical protein
VTAGAANPATRRRLRRTAYVTVIGGAGRVTGLAQGLTLDDVGEGSLTIRYEQTQQQVGLFLYATTARARPPSSASPERGTDRLGDRQPVPDRNLTITSNGAPIRVITFTNADPQGLA